MKIILKRNNVQNTVPTLNELDYGELAINTSDGKLFTKILRDGIQSIVEIGNDGGELKKIEELDSNQNLHTGYALKEDDRTLKGIIGNKAFDLSFTDSTTQSDYGATGDHSFAIGYNTSASGNYSTVQGFQTEASGNVSHAEGYHTTAQNNYMHAEGKYNIGTATDTIHETGIGTSDSNRKNAFEIYTDGKVVAPELTTALIDDVNTSNRVLITKEYFDANNATSLEELTDVDINSKEDEQLLQFNAVTNKWENKTVIVDGGNF